MNGTDVSQKEFPLAVSFPLPFRVLALAGLGILAWATNLHGLDLLGIDVVTTMELRTGDSFSKSTLPAHHPNGRRQAVSNAPVPYAAIYRVFIAYSAWIFLAWCLFRYVTGGDLLLVDAFAYIPGIAALSLVCVLICPFNIMYKAERDKFL